MFRVNVTLGLVPTSTEGRNLYIRLKCKRSLPSTETTKK
jgi:hypothetical protein